MEKKTKSDERPNKGRRSKRSTEKATVQEKPTKTSSQTGTKEIQRDRTETGHVSRRTVRHDKRTGMEFTRLVPCGIEGSLASRTWRLWVHYEHSIV